MYSFSFVHSDVKSRAIVFLLCLKRQMPYIYRQFLCSVCWQLQFILMVFLHLYLDMYVKQISCIFIIP